MIFLYFDEARNVGYGQAGCRTRVAIKKHQSRSIKIVSTCKARPCFYPKCQGCLMTACSRSICTNAVATHEALRNLSPPLNAILRSSGVKYGLTVIAWQLWRRSRFRIRHAREMAFWFRCTPRFAQRYGRAQAQVEIKEILLQPFDRNVERHTGSRHVSSNLRSKIRLTCRIRDTRWPEEPPPRQVQGLIKIVNKNHYIIPARVVA